MLSETERRRAERMIDRRKKEYLLTRVLLRYVVSERLVNVYMSDINVVDREGLPPKVVLAEKSNIHFSISHSNQRICIAVSEQAPLGIDIEFSGKDRAFTDVASRYFSESENRYLVEAETSAEMRRRYYMIWTRKEAWLKLHQMGIGSVPLNTIEFQKIQPDNPESAIASLFDGVYCTSIAAQQAFRLRFIEIKIREYGQLKATKLPTPDKVNWRYRML